MWPAIALLAGALCDDVAVAIVPSVAGASEPRLSVLHQIGEHALRGRCVVPISDSFSLESVLDRCGSEDACIENALGEIGAEAALLIVAVRTKDGWLASVRWVGKKRASANEVASIDKIEQSLERLTAKVVEEIGLETRPQIAEPPTEIREETPIHQEWWFWTAIGVAVVGGAVAIGFALKPGDRCLCTSASIERCEVLCD